MAIISAVSKETINVLTATDPNDFLFHSLYNTFKIVAEGLLTTQTVNADPKTFTLAHGLGYTPNFYAFAEFPDGKVAVPNSADFKDKPPTVQGYGRFDAESDGTNLSFVFTKPYSNYNVNIKYYIFEVPI